MSSKSKAMAKNIQVVKPEEQKTKNICFRIDANLAGIGVQTTYMVVSGVPEDLPPEALPTVTRAAESQFAHALQERKFLEFYSLGKSAKDEQPKFFNTDMLAWVQVQGITEVQL